MKKIKLSLIALFSLGVLFAGNNQGKSDEIYQELKRGDNVFSMSLSKEMIDFFDLDIDLNGKEKLITGDFTEGKMLIINEKKDCSDIKERFEKEGYKLVEIDDEEIDDDDGDAEVYLLISKNGKIVEEAHFLVSEDDKFILLSIFGRMKVENK